MVATADVARPDAVPAVEVHDLSKRFGTVTALDRLTLEIPRCTVFGLLGPNGAGKTTLIRILLGLTRGSSGTAQVLGGPAGSPEARGRLGYMPQDLATYLELTVAENLELFGRLYGVRGANLARRVDEVLRLVHLIDRRRDLVATLSGGLRRRVSFAAALLPDPELLLLDEPTVGVDPELREEFWAYFRALTARGRTILLTTHYLDEATRCDRIAFVYGGALLAEGPPGSVRAAAGGGSMDEAFLALVRARRPGGR
ncbi:MAG: ABC transporter ATP-binding protein [Thermoplasmata archaeon]|nr:ABC transporter ATP-binding protein [Thermoplasmata archaeon]